MTTKVLSNVEGTEFQARVIFLFLDQFRKKNLAEFLASNLVFALRGKSENSKCFGACVPDLR